MGGWANLGRTPPSNQLSQEVEEDKESDVHFPHDRVSTVVPGDMVERGGSCEGRGITSASAATLI